MGLRHHDIGSSHQHYSAIEGDQVGSATLEGLAVSTVIIQSRLARRIALTVCMCLVPISVLAQDALSQQGDQDHRPGGGRQRRRSGAALNRREAGRADGAIPSMSRIGLAETPTSAPRPQPGPSRTGTACSPRQRRRLQSIQVFSRS